MYVYITFPDALHQEFIIYIINSYLHVIGIVRRRCIIGDQWEEFIECFREDTSMLFDQVIFNLKIIVKCPRLNVLLGR